MTAGLKASYKAARMAECSVCYLAGEKATKPGCKRDTPLVDKTADETVGEMAVQKAV